MPTILHVIENLTGGGAAREIIYLAHEAARTSHHCHKILTLKPSQPKGLELAREYRVPVVENPSEQKMVEELRAADIIQISWWNNALITEFLHKPLPPARLVIRYHVAGHLAPHIILPEHLQMADCNILSYDRIPALQELPQDFDPVRLKKIMHGTDFSRIHTVEQKPHRTFNVGYIGTVSWVKMHPDYINMSRAIQVPDIRFIICGNVAEKKLVKQAQQSGVAERFEFRGYVENIGDPISEMDVFGYPLCPETYASTDLVLQEVMYTGIPPVVFPYGGLEQTVTHEENGFVVTTPQEYITAIERLYHDPELRKHLGENARKHIRNRFGIKRSAREYQETYEWLLKQPKRLHVWGKDCDRPLLLQPLTIDDISARTASLSAAALLAKSLGKEGDIFRQALDLHAPQQRLLELDDCIAKSKFSIFYHGIRAYLNFDPDDHHLLFWAGLYYAHTGQDRLAMQSWQKAHENGFEHWRILLYLGAISKRMGQPQLQKLFYDKCMAQLPDAPAELSRIPIPAALGLTKHAASPNKLDQLDAQGQALPNTGQLIDQGEIMFRSGNLPGAVSMFKQALQQQPDLAVAHNNLGVTYWKFGDKLQAKHHFQLALQLDPSAEYIRQSYAASTLSDEKSILRHTSPDRANPAPLTPGKTAPDQISSCLIFLHQPKASGTTLNKILDREYAAQETFRVDGGRVANSLQKLKNLPAHEKTGLRLLRGHMRYGVHKWMPQPCEYITILREPVSRLISLYYYILETTRHYLHKELVTRKISFESFLKEGMTGEIDNNQTRRYSGITGAPLRKCNDELLESAKTNLLEKFTVFGLTERFDESLLLMKNAFNWQNICYERENSTRSRPRVQDISEEALHYIRLYNAFDIKLYTFASHIFDERVKKLGPDFQKQKKAFSLVNQHYQSKIRSKTNNGKQSQDITHIRDIAESTCKELYNNGQHNEAGIVAEYYNLKSFTRINNQPRPDEMADAFVFSPGGDTPPNTVLDSFAGKTLTAEFKSDSISGMVQHKCTENSSSPGNTKTNWPRISIVTPSYNQAQYLEKTIQSILNQNYPNLEYIVIDGGSTDNSVDIIKHYENNLAYWISEKDSGQSHAINKGLNKCTGEVFNWINSDDFLEPQSLLKIAEAYNKHPEASAWIGAVRRLTPDGRTINIVFPNSLEAENIGLNYNGRQFYQPGGFFNRQRVVQSGGVDTSLHYAMDFDLYLRLLQQGVFVKGEGIWANALIHSNAKTQKDRDDLFHELIAIQNNYGYHDGARNRFDRHFNRKALIYFPDTATKKNMPFVENCNQPESNRSVENKRVIFISNYVPRFDVTSSNLRVYQILKILCSHHYKITYLYTKQTGNDKKYIKALPGINFQHLKMDPGLFEQTVSNTKVKTVWITNLWTLPYMSFTVDLARRLKQHGCSVITDTMDFHHKKYLRKYNSGKNPEDLSTANKFLKLEKNLYNISDTVITVTPDEAKDIRRQISETLKIEVIPNIHHISGQNIDFRKTKHICFLGNFNVNHNIDAAEHFINNIFPVISSRIPEIEFHIFGNHSKEKLEPLSSDRVKIMGFVDDLDKTLCAYRLFVCPMTYGAGMKGKIGSAASVGLPFVTTSIGSEGFPFIDGKHCFISDSPEEFAEKCIHLILDPITWNNFSLKSKILLARNYSIKSISIELAAIFNRLPKTDIRPSLTNSLAEELKHKGWQQKHDIYKPVFESADRLNTIDAPAISIIVISWRLHPDNIKNFEALSHQRDQNFELIFVNNGGGESEFDVLKPFIDTSIKLNKNTGAYLARNIGAVFAKAPLLLFLEDDGIPAAGFVREHIKAHTRYDVIAVRGVYSPRTDNPLNAIAEHYYLGPEPFPWYSSLEGNSSYPADIFFQVGGWNDAIAFGHGGRELSIRLSQIEPDLRKQLYCPGPVIYHDYARDKKHYRNKIARQKTTLAHLLQQYPRWHDYFRFWEQHKHRTDLVLRKEAVPAAVPGPPDIDTTPDTAPWRTGPSAMQAARVDFLACEHHNFSHLLPVWEKIPAEQKGAFYILTLLDAADRFKEKEKVKNLKIYASTDKLIQDLNLSRRLLVTSSFYDQFLQQVIRPMVFVAHGGGQTYLGQPLHLYPRKNYVLDIIPNHHMAEVFDKRYPLTEKHVVGCPKLDTWHTTFKKKDNPRPVVALSFHFDRQTVPETRSSWPHFKPALEKLAAQKQWKILGHGHPRMIDTLTPYYEQYDIKIVNNFDDVLEKADLYICDHMATLYEFASTERPVVVLNAPWYRRDVEHGLRYWEHADVGINCNHPDELISAIKTALSDPPEQKEKRRKAVQAVYTYTDGKASKRAARAIINFNQKTKGKNNGLLYPDASEDSINNFIHHSTISEQALDHHYNIYLAKLRQVSGRVEQPSECGVSLKDAEYYFWTLALLLFKSGRKNDAIGLCADFKKAFGVSEKLETLNRFLSSGPTDRTAKNIRPQPSPKPIYPGSSAEESCHNTDTAFKKDDLQKAVTSFDHVLERIDPLDYSCIRALRDIEKASDKKWRESRENRFINRLKANSDPATMLQAAQFYNSPKVMEAVYTKLNQQQQDIPPKNGRGLVTIIIAVHNSRGRLKKSIDSVIRQNYQNWELIIIDDGSNDNTWKEISSLKIGGNNKIITKKLPSNQGVSYARNEGFKFSSGRYITFLDCGDELLPAYLDELTAALGKFPQAAWVYPVTLQKGSINRFWSYREFNLTDTLSKNLQPVTSLMRREVFEQIGGFSTEFKQGYEDWNFFISAARQGFTGKLHRKILFVYHKEEHSRNSQLQSFHEKEYRSKRQLIRHNRECYKTIGKDEEILLKQNLRIPEILVNKHFTPASAKPSSHSPNQYVVQFYIYKNVHWPMFENLFHYLKDRSEIKEIILCLPDIPQLLGAQNYELIDKLFSLGATVSASPYTQKADVTFIADTIAGKVQGCGKIVNVGHGTISKGYYFTESVWTERENWVDLLCVPGPYALQQFKGHLKTRVVATGMPKMDPVFSGKYDRNYLCSLLGIDPEKKIILYAPTFNMDLSSVYHFADRISALATPDRYLLIKLHGSTLANTVAAYQKLAKKHDNMHFVNDPNIAPYIGGADIMVSDVSSAYMEFMALDKPVILYNNPNCDKYHGYNPDDIEYKWRDLGIQVENFDELEYKLNKLITAGDDKSDVRRTYAKRLFADLQGKASANVWTETLALIEANTTGPELPLFSDIITLTDNNLFAVREVVHNLQFYAAMSHELVLINRNTTPEGAAFIKMIRQFSQFKHIETVHMDSSFSREQAVMESLESAGGDIILFIDETTGLHKNFDYIIYKTFQNNPDTPALTGLTNLDRRGINYLNYIKPEGDIPFSRIAYDFINKFQGKKIATVHPDKLPPFYAVKASALAPALRASESSLEQHILPKIRISLSLLYSTIPPDDMTAIKSFWSQKDLLPGDQMVKFAQSILENYMYPDIAEILLRTLDHGNTRKPNIPLMSKSIFMRYYDIEYKKHLRSLPGNAPEFKEILDKDINIIEQLSSPEKIKSTINNYPEPISVKKYRILFYFFKNVHIPVLIPIYKTLKQNYPDMEIAFGYMTHAPRIRAGFTGSELQALKAFGEKMYDNPLDFNPDLTFIADSVYPWVKDCGRLVHVGHGVLSKGQYYTNTETARREEQADLVCVPGPYHKTIMQRVISKPVVATGMAKLDGVFSSTVTRETVLKKFGLPPHFRYILFAPTFNDELSAVPFVRDRINNVIPDDRTALIIKLHGSAKPEHKTMYQNLVEKDPRVIFADELDITPFLALGDVIISDVSSAMMEFAALDKPVILFNNPGWKSYQNYHPDDIEFKWRDIGIEVTNLDEMKQAVARSLSRPGEYSKKRNFYTELLFANKNDGRAAQRIIEEALALLQNCEKLKGAA